MNQIIRELKRQSAGEKLAPEQLKALILTDKGRDALAQLSSRASRAFVDRIGAGMTANLEEAGAWYYVVDCAICKAVVPFKHAHEDDQIVRFPTMRVRCFHCHTDHTYSADLISRRKTAAPRAIFKRDRPPSHAGDGDREASRDRQEDRGVGASGGRVILNREIDPISFSLRCYNMLIVAVSGRRATIFFLSLCFFIAGSVLRLALETLYPVPLAVLNETRSSFPAMLLGNAFSGTVLFGFVLFILGTGSFFAEACGGFKAVQDRFDHLCRQAVERSFGTVKTWIGRRTNETFDEK